MSILAFSERGMKEEEPLGRAHVYKDILLDIPAGERSKQLPDGSRKNYQIQIGNEGSSGLHDYLEDGMMINEERLRFPQNPAVAMRVIPYFYRKRGRMMEYEGEVERTLSQLKQGERVVNGTDLDNVSIVYERVSIPKEHSPYPEERLQMSVLVDYLK